MPENPRHVRAATRGASKFDAYATDMTFEPDQAAKRTAYHLKVKPAATTKTTLGSPIKTETMKTTE